MGFNSHFSDTEATQHFKAFIRLAGKPLFFFGKETQNFERDENTEEEMGMVYSKVEYFYYFLNL